jgi:predicted Zn-dependent protease
MNQASQPGVITAVQNAMNSWNSVIPGAYSLSYAGTTNAGVTIDNQNTILWGTGGSCTGSCLALTTLVLASGQVITEADVMMNSAAVWNTNGSDTDVEAIAAHELGHTLGIHHTEITKRRNRPTMYSAYFGIDGRSLELDDKDALICSHNRYGP